MLQIVTSVPTNCDAHFTESIFQTHSIDCLLSKAFRYYQYNIVIAHILLSR
ncbi:MAG: DUF6783 domain-containing protein [Blautia wexlerae]|uniref:DUF6783 domain-containing protein n=1 Tax=Bacteria TaxID=2 RepID=UPI0032EC7CF1